MMHHIDFEINGKTYTVDRLHGFEELGRPFWFQVSWRMPKTFDTASWIGQPAHLLFYNSSEPITLSPVRTFCGVITHTEARGAWKDQDRQVKLTIRPRIALLHNWNGPRVFLNQNVTTILETLLKDHAGYGTHQIHWHLKRSLPFKSFTLQVPHEKDSAFFLRLIARYGVYYWIDQQDIHFTDQHSLLPQRTQPLIYTEDRGLGSSALTQSRVIQKRAPEKFIIRDYFEDYPDQIIQATASSASTPQPWLIQNIYGLGVKTSDEAQQLADLYLERAQVESQSVVAYSHAMDLSAGLRVALGLAPTQAKHSGNYVITAVEHCFSRTEEESQNQTSTSKRHRRLLSQRPMLKGTGYRERFKAIPVQHPFRLPLPKFPSMPFNLSAFIEPNEVGQIMDEQGRYRVHFHFDRESVPGQGSIPLRRIQRDAGPMSIQDADDQKVGQHFPLSAGTEVLVGFWNGNPDRPVILAAVPSPQHPGPVTEINPTQSILRTPKGQELIFEEHSEKSHMALRNADNTQELKMSCSPTDDNLYLRSRIGDLNTYSKGDSQLSTQAKAQTIIFGNQTLESEKTFERMSQQGIHQQTEKEVHLSAQQDIQIQSAQGMEMTCAGNIDIHMDQQMQIKGDSALFSAQKGSLNIQGDHIQFTSSGPIHIGTQNSGILLDPSGEVIVYGPSVSGMNLSSPDIQSDPSPGALLGAPSITTPQSNAEIPDIEPRLDLHISNLYWSQTESEVSQLVDACFTIQNGKPGDRGTVKIYRQTPDDSKQNVAVLSFHLTEKAGFLNQHVSWTPSESMGVGDSTQNQDHLDTLLSKGKAQPQFDRYLFEVTLGIHEFQDKKMCPLTLQKTVHLKPVYANGQPLPPGIGFHWQLPSGEIKKVESTGETVTLGQLALGQYRIQLLSDEIPNLCTLELLDSQCRHPFPIGLLAIRSLKESQDPILIHVLPPFSGLDFREDSLTWDQNSQKPCSDFILDSLKKNGNNVTLFIHGYNVPKGEWGYYYEDIVESNRGNKIQPEYVSSQGQRVPCTVYRDRNTIREQFPQLIQSDGYSSHESGHHPWKNLEEYEDQRDRQELEKFMVDTLNGTEGRRWSVEMEHNLNCAAGWDEKDYKAYSRMMPILWTGDCGVTGFMQAVKNTARAGKRLAILIRYLKTSGISEINVIAHSLGNEVLLLVMQELGGQNQALLNHVFLWEAAVPQNAFSSTPCQHGYGDAGQWKADASDPPVTREDIRRALWYDFPKAYAAAQKITVLFSQNDNVLGPPLSDDELKTFKLDRAAIMKSKPWEERLGAQLTARLAGCPFDSTIWPILSPWNSLEIATQDQIYQIFKESHSSERCRTTQQLLEETLDKEIAELRHYLPKIASILGQQKTATPALDEWGKTIRYPHPRIAEELLNIEQSDQTFRYSISLFNDDIANPNDEIADLGTIPAFDGWIYKHFLYQVSDMERNKKVIGKTQWALDPNALSFRYQRYVYLCHILRNECSFTFPPAMGYAGVDLNDTFFKKLHDAGQLMLVNQTPWLWSHSGMMVPSNELMEEVYKKRIWIKNTDFHFGKYRQ